MEEFPWGADPHLSHPSPPQVLHHQLELTRLEAPLHRHPQPVEAHQPRVTLNPEALSKPQVDQRLPHVGRVRDHGLGPQRLNQFEDLRRVVLPIRYDVAIRFPSGLSSRGASLSSGLATSLSLTFAALTTYVRGKAFIETAAWALQPSP